MENKKSKLLNILYIISVISLVILGSIIVSNNFLPNNLRNNIFLGALAFYIIMGLLLIKFSKRSRLATVFTSITLVFLLGSQSLASYYIQNTYSRYNQNLELSGESVKYTLITLENNPVNTVKEMGEAEVFYGKDDSKKDIKKMSDKLISLNNRLKFIESENSSKNYRDLIDGKLKYMILNNSIIDILEEERKNFDNKVKVIQFESDSEDSSVIVDNEHKSIVKETEPEESFILYISGADGYSDSSEPTRTDVNIILAINPKTNNILMTSIPRDSYVYMTDLGYDKLTHTGIYGIRKSITTLENLLDIDINYYAKVNFTSLIELVDVLGGVSVYNDQDFTSRLGRNYYPKGNVELDGKLALDFVRERYNLANGDQDRAKNQMKVLEAIIRKGMSPSILLNYNTVLETVLKSVNTNVPARIMTSLVNNQLETSAGWKITNNVLTGYDSYNLPSYAMPYEQLYMLNLDNDSVMEANEKIMQIINGQ